MSLVTPSTGRAATSATTSTTGRNKQKARWAGWANTGINKSIKISDWAAPYVNGLSNAFGAERFWPSSGDYVEEMDKCARILKGFTKDGFVHEEEQVVPDDDPSGHDVVQEQIIGPDGTPITPQEAAKLQPGQTRTAKLTRHIKKVNIVRKIPPEVLNKAKGIAIYTSMRSGMAPFGGSGGSGLVMARLPNGTWSAPSFITPQNASVGLMFGLDVYDVVLLIMADEALEGFKTHKVTLGAETAVAAGPVGTGASMDMSVNGVDWTDSGANAKPPPGAEKKKMVKPPAPLFSYTRNRGFYAGFEGMAMIYLTRADENERVYHWPGVTGRDVLDGKVHKPAEARALYEALAAAESGEAQSARSRLEDKADADANPSPQSFTRELVLDDGERLELPLTPEEIAELELMGIKNTQAEEREAEDYKAYIWSMPEPPRHPAALARASGLARTKAGNRFVAPQVGTGGMSSQSPQPQPQPQPQLTSTASSSRLVAPAPSQLSSSSIDTADPAPPLGLARSQSLASSSSLDKVETPPAYTAAPAVDSLGLAVDKGLMVSEPEGGGNVHVATPEDKAYDAPRALSELHANLNLRLPPLHSYHGGDFAEDERVDEYLIHEGPDVAPAHHELHSAASTATHGALLEFDEKPRSRSSQRFDGLSHDEVHDMAPIAL